MSDQKLPNIRVRPQDDGTTLYDVPVPLPEVRQEVKILVNRGKGDELNIEQD
jgi:hypothetical protein